MKILLNKVLFRSLSPLLVLVFGAFGLSTNAQMPLDTTSQTTTIDKSTAMSGADVNAAHPWLVRMSQAISELNYQISFVVLKPGVDAQPYLWRHAVTSAGDEMEQLNLLNGPGREMLRINGQVSYFEPNVPPYSLQSDVINGPLPSAFFHDPLALLNSYEFIMVGRSRVAGKAAQQIRIISRDKTRYGFNLWLDQESGLLLKLDMIDLQGQRIEQIQVTELIVTQAPHDYFQRVELDKLPAVIDIRSSARSKLNWDFDFLPVGMQLIKSDVHRLPLTGDLVVYMMLSDGLIDISVYLQEASNTSADSDVLLRHESNTFLTRRQGPLLVTVVGKLPAQTANAIAASIKLVN